MEAAGLVLALALYKYCDRLAFLTLRQWAWILAPSAAVVVSVAYISHCYLRSRRSPSRQFSLTLAISFVALAAALSAGETLIRLFSVRTPLGVSFGRTVLLPKSWEDVRARNAELLKSAPFTAYFVSDTLMGWTVGPSRHSADGLSLSSVEGIRSPRAGIAYADHPAPHRIVTVGDSFTFGADVPFQDSWGFQLERGLGADFEVLNFGVGGYGVDQAYLRYLRDARPLRPAVAIFGFIQHDLYRSLTVYTFVSFPDWETPFSKPRFRLRDGRLELLNVPLISPYEILTKGSIADLPFVKYDPGYNAAEWEWHSYFSSRLLRFLLSRFPRWPPPKPENPEVGDEAEQRINSELLLAFARQATADGTVPLVVYLPSRGDFQRQDRSAKDGVLAILQRFGVRYLNLTSCIGEVGPDKAFIPGMPHYSADGNAAVARCLLPTIRHLVRSK